MNAIAEINDLKCDPMAILTPMVKKNLVEVVNKEFDSQKTIYDATKAEKEEQILEQYKKGVGFDKWRKEYDKARADEALAVERRKKLETKINLKGLTTEGNQHNPSYYGNHTEEQRQIKKACDKVDKLLRTAEAQGPNNVRNKIICRLWMANTMGEAMVILRSVLGNGIIPSLKINELPAIGYNNE